MLNEWKTIQCSWRVQMWEVGRRWDKWKEMKLERPDYKCSCKPCFFFPLIFELYHNLMKSPFKSCKIGIDMVWTPKVHLKLNSQEKHLISTLSDLSKAAQTRLLGHPHNGAWHLQPLSFPINSHQQILPTSYWTWPLPTAHGCCHLLSL